MARLERLLIWGSGGHGKVVADLARVAGHHVAGYVDRDAAKLNLEVEPGGARVVVLEDALIQLLGQGRLLDGADAIALGLGGNAARATAYHLAGSRLSGALIHPSAAVSAGACLGRGAVVLARAAVNAAAQVGAAAIVNTGAIIEHDCQVGEAAHLSPGSVLCGGVIIGPRAWIGAGAVVIQGIQVGADATVGAGAVVIRDVPPGTTVVGNPARILRSA